MTADARPTLSPAEPDIAGKARHWLAPLLGVVLFAASLYVLRHELRAVSYRQLSAALFAVPAYRLALALLFTAFNYAVLTGYDQLAFAYVRKRLPRAHIALASFVAYAIANNVGFAMLSGTSVRYRFYSRWGVTAGELSRIVFFYSTTFWLGLVVLGGGSLALRPLPALVELPLHGPLRALGALLLLAALGYVVLASVRRTPLRLGKVEIGLPTPRLVAAQLVVSVLDWTLAAGVLYALLPPSDLRFGQLLGAFLASQLLGLVSHVPGGLGVFESLMVVLVKPALNAAQLLPALLLYRFIYYLLPLAVALVLLVADELRQRRHHAARLGAAFGALMEEVTPRLLAVFTFLAGAVLLFSGATPAARARLRLLSGLLPLPVLEATHFMGSVVGVVLLLVSQGVARRLDASYYLAAASLATGIVTSLVKGGDFEEATLLALVLLALVRSRPHFDRKAAFFATRFSPGWVVAVVAVVVASIWLGLFSFKHVEYSRDLWWQFALHHEASRFLRASVGASVVLLAFGVGRLLRPAPPALVLPTEEELDAVGRAIEAQTSTFPYLVYLRDKAILLHRDGDAFIMYGVQGRTWAALGDPVGPLERGPALIREFLERCDDYDGIPVFYEVTKDRLHQYADFGLTFMKMGEDARVPLQSFGLGGGEHKGFRMAIRRLEKAGGSFRIVPAAEVPAILDGLEEVSDDWLRHRGAAEKGFSLGFFDRRYLARFPVALVERAARIEAFANVWPGPGKVELSVDLMRFRDSAPPNVMEALFVHLMLWGKEQGYEWFSLGMAPLSGLEGSPVAPLWNRMSAFVYRHGEALYNFQGLRAYKEKFHPVWEPRYLAYPGGFAAARILADVAALVAGGYARIFAR